MFDGLKRSGQKKASPEADELRELIASARQEGQALVALTDRLADRGADAKMLATEVARVEKAAGEAGAKLNAVQGRLARVEAVAKSVEEIESLATVLRASVKDAGEAA